MDNLNLNKAEVDNLESLTEELIEVFIFENIDRSNDAQKENLIQRVLKLGGDNYTREDLKRDLLKIEGDDRDKEALQLTKDVPKILQGKDFEGNDFRKLTTVEDRSTNKHLRIIEKLLQELEVEDMEGIEGNQSEISLSAQKNIEYLGIQMNRDGIKSPKYGQVKSKRGRKSLKELRELREVDGQAREQKKINQLFNIGKGRILPKET